MELVSYVNATAKNVKLRYIYGMILITWCLKSNTIYIQPLNQHPPPFQWKILSAVFISLIIKTVNYKSFLLHVVVLRVITSHIPLHTCGYPKMEVACVIQKCQNQTTRCPDGDSRFPQNYHAVAKNTSLNFHGNLKPHVGFYLPMYSLKPINLNLMYTLTYIINAKHKKR